jgi:hypothetical protein
LQEACRWGDEPTDGAWQAAHALVTLAGHLADVLADGDRLAAGSGAAAVGRSAAAAGSAAAAAAPAAAAGVAADDRPAGPAGGERSSSTEAEAQAAWRAYTAAAVQPDAGDLVATAADGAVAVASWAVDVLERVQRLGVYPNRLEKA